MLFPLRLSIEPDRYYSDITLKASRMDILSASHPCGCIRKLYTEHQRPCHAPASPYQVREGMLSSSAGMQFRTTWSQREVCQHDSCRRAASTTSPRRSDSKSRMGTQ